MKSTAPKISMRGGGANDSTNTATHRLAGLAVRAVVAHAVVPAGQLAHGVAGDHPVEVGVAERALGGLPGSDEQLGAGVGARRRRWPAPTGSSGADARRPGRRRRRSVPVERLEEQVDGAAAGEADGERLVVAVAERVAGRARAGRQRPASASVDHRALDAAARHRADDLAVARSRPSPPRVRRGPSPRGRPPGRGRPAGPAGASRSRSSRIPHVSSLHRPSTSARAARGTPTEWPSTNSSTCGRAAAMPRASGA